MLNGWVLMLLQHREDWPICFSCCHSFRGVWIKIILEYEIGVKFAAYLVQIVAYQNLFSLPKFYFAVTSNCLCRSFLLFRYRLLPISHHCYLLPCFSSQKINFSVLDRYQHTVHHLQIASLHAILRLSSAERRADLLACPRFRPDPQGLILYIQSGQG